MKNSKSLRKHLFVDYKVQGSLINRAIAYWFMCLFTITLMILCWRMVTGPARMFYTHFDYLWFQFGPAFIGSLFILPLVVYDVVQLSNRFVGPLLRLRRSLKALARGEDVAPLQFRGNDFWQEFATEFNSVAERMHKLNQSAPAEEIDDQAVLAGSSDGR